MKKIFFFTFLLFSINTFSQQFYRIDKSQLDSTLKSNFVDGYHWKDKNGENYVILSTTKPFEKDIGSQMRYVKISAVNVTSLRKEKRAILWKYNATLEKCHEVNDLIARFILESFTITDLNEDGICEVWVMQKMSCRTDITPAELKLVMHEGKKEFIISGHSRAGHTKDAYLGGDQTQDSNFKSGPKVFRDYGQKLFEKFINEDWK